VFLIALFGMILNAAAQSGFGALMKPLVDEGFIKRNPQTVQQVPLLMLLLVAARGVAGFLAEYATAWIARKVIFDLRNACFERLLRLPCSYFDLHASGRLVAKLIYDLEQIAGAVTQALVTVIGDGLLAAVLTVNLLYLNWLLALLLFLVSAVSS